MVLIIQKIRTLILALLTFWPPVHMMTVDTSQISMWKYFSFGMFAGVGDWMDGGLRVSVVFSDRGNSDKSILSIIRTQPTNYYEELFDIFIEDASGLRRASSLELSMDQRNLLEQAIEKVMVHPRAKYLEELKLQLANQNKKFSQLPHLYIFRSSSRWDPKSGEPTWSFCQWSWKKNYYLGRQCNLEKGIDHAQIARKK